MQIYKAKTLFAGSVIDKVGTYAAVPDGYKGEPFVVDYKGEHMMIEDWDKADGFRVFPDKFNREKNYTLGYFKWQPNGTLKEK
jgi:hypothetical protein